MEKFLVPALHFSALLLSHPMLNRLHASITNESASSFQTTQVDLSHWENPKHPKTIRFPIQHDQFLGPMGCYGLDAPRYCQMYRTRQRLSKRCSRPNRLFRDASLLFCVPSEISPPIFWWVEHRRLIGNLYGMNP